MQSSGGVDQAAMVQMQQLLLQQQHQQHQQQQQQSQHQQPHEAPGPTGRGFGAMPPPPGAVSGIGMAFGGIPTFSMSQYAAASANQSVDMPVHTRQEQEGVVSQQHLGYAAAQVEAQPSLATAAPQGAAINGGFTQTVYTVPPGSIVPAPAGYMPQRFGAPLLRTVRPGMIGAMASIAPRPTTPTTAGVQKESAKRVTVWNKKENRKISGNAAPMEKNLHDYLRKHPECEVYSCQDKETRAMDSVLMGGVIAGMGASDDDKGSEKRITIWNKRETRKISGNAAPLEKNLWTYLRDHPDYEVYNGQDKRPDEYKRVWKENDDKKASPGLEILGESQSERQHGEFSFKDQFGGSPPGSWGASGSPAGTPWGMQLAGATDTPHQDLLPIEAEAAMSVPRDGEMSDMTIGSIGSVPTMGSMGSMHLGSIGSSVGSLGFELRGNEMQVDEDDSDL